MEIRLPQIHQVVIRGWTALTCVEVFDDGCYLVDDDKVLYFSRGFGYPLLLVEQIVPKRVANF